MKVSVIIPVFNEKDFIVTILDKLEQVSFFPAVKEVVIVDDCSTDGTKTILENFQDKYKIIFHHKNQGKGAALKTGFKNATGDIIAIQDADLEYNPQDLKKLVVVILAEEAQVVYGSRMTAKNPVGHYAYYLGNKLISLLTRILYGSKLTDVETCYKVFKKEILDNLNLEEDDFGFEVEFTAKVLKSGLTIKELPISYNPRKFSQGKKISWQDGIKAIGLLFKYRFSNVKKNS